jgi:hypothetical protein
MKQHFFNVLYKIIIVKNYFLLKLKRSNLFFKFCLGPARVFWVVGNATGNSVLITDYLSTNKHNGDRIRRVFALSPFDYSVELTINRDTYERSYSCVIDGSTDAETTLFTYIVRSIGKLIYSVSFYHLFLFRSSRHPG